MRRFLLKTLLTWSLFLPLIISGQSLSGEIVSLNEPGCSGPLYGDITVLGIDGASPYSYSLDATITQASGFFESIELGDHIITIADANGDEYTISFSMEIINQLSISIIDLSHVECFGDSNGSLSVVASSGASPFQFSIDGGATFQPTGEFSNLSAGFYEIIAKDASNCFDTINAEIIALSHINIISINKVNVACSGDSTGSVQLLGELGTSPYQYSMDGISYQANGLFSDIPFGPHQFWIEDLNGCTDSITLNFSEPSALQMANFDLQSPICYGASSGEIAFTASGGVNPYTFQIDGMSTSSTPLFQGQVGGDHLITMIDNNNCELDTVITIVQPDSLFVSIDDYTLPLCSGENNASISFSGIGGSAPYQYKLNTGSWLSSGYYTGLAAGSYTLKVKDSSGCVSTSALTIPDQVSLTIALINKTDVYCNISTNGSITVNSSGGVPPYVYSINAGPTQSSGVFSSLGSGSYSISVTDQNMCSESIDVEIIETTSLSIDAVAVNEAICGLTSTGDATISASGGLAPYEYSLDFGPNQNSNYFNIVGIGMHDISVYTSDGCSVSSTFYLGESSPLLGNVISHIDPLCEGGVNGSIEIEGSNGFGPYSYSITGGMSWQASGVFSGLTDSTYFLIIRDQNLCSFDTLIILEEQSNLSVDLISLSPAICPNSSMGFIDVDGQNGSSPYSYSIDNGTYIATSLFSGLDEGDHSISVMDANGCVTDSLFTIDALEMPAITIDSLISPTCNGSTDGVIMISPDATALPYLYSFSASPFSPTNYFTGLSAGTYTIIVQDNNVCEKTFNLTLTDIPTFSAGVDSIHHVQCKNEEQGIVYYSFTGGLSPYTVRVNNGPWLNAGTSLGPLFAGLYQLDFKDDNGCVYPVSVQIDEPANAINVQILSVVNVQCASDSTGSVLAFANGGTPPFSYSLDNINFQSSGSFSGLSVGDYTVYVKDNNDCTGSETFSIIANSPIPLAWNNVVPPSCESVNNGSLDVQVLSGANPPYYYSLNSGPAQSGSVFSNLGEGYYQIYVEDFNGCSNLIDTLLTSISDLSIIVDSTQNIVCVADSSGEIFLGATGGSPTYSFFVEGTALSGNSIQNLSNGVYLSWVVDAVGCADSTEVAILQESLLQGSILSQQNILCNNGSLGAFTVTGTTGSSPYLYSLDGFNFSTNNTFTDLELGDYVVTIQDASNCQTEVDVSIEVLTELDLQIQSLLNPTCFDVSDGQLVFSTSNGIGPYTYSLDGGTPLSNNEFINLNAGVYLVHSFDSQGCSDSLEVTLVDPPQVSMTVDSMAMATCNGVDDGYISVTAQNAVGNASYSISPSNLSNTTGLFENLSDGTYIISIVDENGCSVDSSFIISSPSAMSLSFDLLNPLDCFGDENAIIEVIASGGTVPYEYWIDSVSNGVNQFINNLDGGTHNLIVIDQNDCQTSLDFEIEEPDSLYFQYTNVSNISCYGQSNGSAYFIANGGEGVLSYSLNSQVSSSGQYTNLGPGNYELIVTDTSGCSLNYDFTIIEPDTLIIDSILITPPSCYGDSDGSIEIEVTGGDRPYNYFIPGLGSSDDSVFTDLDAGAYYISVTDDKGCNQNQIIVINDPDVFELGLSALTPPLCYNEESAKVILQTTGGNGSPSYGLSWTNLIDTNLFTNLSAGLNTFYSLDSLGCRDSLTVYIPQTDSIIAVPIVTQPTCYNYSDGTVNIFASGGNGGFEYSIDQVNWNTTGVFNGLPAGIYNFQIMDANECIKEKTVIIGQPDSLYAEVLFVHPVTCSDESSGEISVQIYGGTEPFESIVDGDVQYGNAVTFSGLGIGSYQVLVYDNNTCSTSVDTLINQVDSLDILVEPVALSCYGDDNGIATVNFSGGSGDYIIQWDNITEDETASTQANLIAGVTYTVVVRDSLDEDCMAIAQVTPTQPEQIDFELFPFSSSCDPNDVSVSVEILEGGVAPFMYSINNAAPVNSGIFESLSSVSTLFSVLDADGCSQNEWLVPENPNMIEAFFEVSAEVVSMADGDVQFTNYSFNSEYLKWDFADGTSVEGLPSDLAVAYETGGIIQSPIHNYTTFGQYNVQLIASSDFGCEDSYEKTIIVEEDHRVYIPNSFTPDGDGINDVFKVEGTTIQSKNFSMIIYDRLGDVIFESFNVDEGWDGNYKNGNKATPQVYVFVVSYYSGDRFYEKNGTVTLLR